MDKTIDYKKIMELVDSYREKGFSISTSVKKVQLSTPELEKVNYLTLRKNIYKLINTREKDINKYIELVDRYSKSLVSKVKEIEEIKVVSKLTFWQKLKNIFGFS